MDPTFDGIWRFVRGDTSPREFEQWVYAHRTLEDLLGKPFYLDVISVDYGDSDAMRRLRSALDRFVRSASPPPCECIALPDTAVIDMADPGRALEHFREIARRGEPYWWLGMSRCTVCGSTWLVAQEERQNDVFLLHRLAAGQVRDALDRGEWPADFDRYETLLRLAREAGHSVIFVDPIGGSSLAWTIRDLARERPGIRVSELAKLLNLDAGTAAAIAREVIVTQGAAIDIDVDAAE